jgi:hypothetical protein
VAVLVRQHQRCILLLHGGPPARTMQITPRRLDTFLSRTLT